MGQAWCREKSSQDCKTPLDRVFVRCAHRLYPSLKEEGSVLGGGTQRVTSSEIGYAGSPPRSALLRGRSIDSVDRPFHPSEWVDVNVEVPGTPRASILYTNFDFENDVPQLHSFRMTTEEFDPIILDRPASNRSNGECAALSESPNGKTPVPPPRRRRHKNREASIREENETRSSCDEHDGTDQSPKLNLNNYYTMTKAIDEEENGRIEGIHSLDLESRLIFAKINEQLKLYLETEDKKMSKNRSAEDILARRQDLEAEQRPKNHSTSSLPNFDELVDLQRRHENSENSPEMVCEEAQQQAIEELQTNGQRSRRDSFEEIEARLEGIFSAKRIEEFLSDDESSENSKNCQKQANRGANVIPEIDELKSSTPLKSYDGSTSNESRDSSTFLDSKSSGDQSSYETQEQISVLSDKLDGDTSEDSVKQTDGTSNLPPIIVAATMQRTISEESLPREMLDAVEIDHDDSKEIPKGQSINSEVSKQETINPQKMAAKNDVPTKQARKSSKTFSEMFRDFQQTPGKIMSELDNGGDDFHAVMRENEENIINSLKVVKESSAPEKPARVHSFQASDKPDPVAPRRKNRSTSGKSSIPVRNRSFCNAPRNNGQSDNFYNDRLI